MTSKTNKPSETQAVAVKQDGGALALPFDYGKHANRGKENMTTDDSAIPFIRILQSNSPQVKKGEARIPGAEEGMFLNTVSNEVFDKFYFIPCATDHLYVEWKPRSQGGGFAGRHPLHSGIMSKTKKGGENGRKDVLPNGHEIVETFYVVGMILDTPDATMPSGFAMLAFTSSGITRYKKSIGELRKVPNAPLYGFKLEITTDQQSNSDGSWSNWVIRPVGLDPNDPVFRNGIVTAAIDPTGPQAGLLDLGEKLCDEYLAGAANIAYNTQDAGNESSSDDTHF